MSSINSDYKNISRTLEITQKVATAAKWVGIAVTVLAIGSFFSAAMLSGQGHTFAFMGVAGFGGVAFLALITYVVFRHLNSKADKKLTGEAIFNTLGDNYENNMKLIKKLGPKGFKRLVEVKDLKDKPTILSTLAQFPKRIVANLMYIDPDALKALDCKGLDPFITPLLGEVNSETYNELFDLYGEISLRFGQPHPFRCLRESTQRHGEIEDWEKDFRKAVSPEIKTFIENLKTLAEKDPSLKPAVTKIANNHLLPKQQ